MDEYWNGRFKNGGMIWGAEPSPTAAEAAEWFAGSGVKRVLVPGAGYGRNTKAFSERFRTEGIELSAEAVKLAEAWDPLTVFRQGSVLDPDGTDGPFDGIYAYDILHLFLAGERERLIANCREWLSAGGLIYVTCFSDEDPHCGTGPCVEEGTYEYSPGKYAHFFTEQDLLAHFGGFQVLSTGTREETLRYGSGEEKRYILRILTARKPS